MGSQLPNTINANTLADTNVDVLILSELRAIHLALLALVEMERERREAERKLEEVVESIKPLRGLQEQGGPNLSPPGASSWDEVPWDDAPRDRPADWWYRDDQKIMRERGTDRPLSQDEINLIMNPPGRPVRRK